METELADTLPAKKINMRTLYSVSTFTIQLPLDNPSVCILFHLFCGNPLYNGKKKYSYSIVGKIEGVRNIEATADIISDYGKGNQLKDHLNFERGQFIFSNHSQATTSFDIRMQVKGILSSRKMLSADISIQMNYNLRQIFVNGIKTRYTLKNIHEPGLILLQ